MKQKLQIKFFTLVLLTLLVSFASQGQNDLEFKGIMSLQTGADSSNTERAIHLKAVADIADLSIYGIGIPNNGGGSDGREMNLPAISVAAGDDILFIRDEDESTLSEYLGTCFTAFEHTAVDGGINFNGDDGVELYLNDEVIEIYGDTLADGSGLEWEYTGSWAYKENEVWTYGGVDCSGGSTTTQSSACPYPLCPTEVDSFPALMLQGIMSLQTGADSSNTERAIHLKAVADIADLSIYGIGIPNNGGGSDGREMNLPAISVAAGDDILFIRDEDESTLSEYLGTCFTAFEHTAVDGGINFNGDDGVELYLNDEVIEIYGDTLADGSGLEWEYTGSWAYKENEVWTYGGVDCSGGSTTTQSSACPYPLCPTEVDSSPALMLQGIMSLQTGADSSNTERAIHLKAVADIADLSIYGIGIPNNGGGSDGREMNLPAISVAAGDDILFIRDEDESTLSEYLGTCFTAFEHTAVDGGINFNGDDGVELYLNDEVIEIYGDTLADGSGLEWEYTGSWAYKENEVWTYGGVDCSGGSTTMEDSPCPYPMCDFTQEEETPSDLELKGIMALSWTTSGTNGGKAVHLRAKADIADLSVYALGVANNGGGTDSIEYRFPVMSVSAGDDILLAREDSTLSAYFASCASEFEHVIQSEAMNQNGDDAIELYGDTTVIETYGDVNVDGTGEVWEYSGSWAYKENDTWTYGGIDCAANSTTMENSPCPYPLCNFSDSQGIERSVLFIGNSFTFYFDMPGLVQQMAASVGDLLVHDENTEGGYELKDHVADEVSVSKIKLGGWDYVVLQEQSTLPIRDASSFYSNAAKLDSIRKISNPIGDVMFYMTWGRKDGFQTLSYEQMSDDLRAKYLMAQSNQNGLISPVGAVWRYVRSNNPELELYDPDGSHPSNIGSYLSACSFYTTIFQKDPTALSFDFELSSVDAQTIREAVKAVVFDSLSFWNDYKPLRSERITIDFDSLENGQVYVDTTEIDLSVTTSSEGSNITEVLFMVNGDTVSVDDTAPFDPTFTLETIGQYTITAVATDANGGKNYAIRNIRRSEPSNANALEMIGIISFQTGLDSANRERAIHLKANEDISDLSVFGIGIPNNGGGSDGREMNLPAISVSAGDDILFIRDEDVTTIAAYFGACFDEFDHTAEDAGINFNGDDGVELYLNDEVIEIYGDVIEDGTGLAWEYTGSWAFKVDGAWTNGAINCTGGSLTTQGSACPYPFCSTENLATDATLSDLQVDGVTVDGFATDVLSYLVELPTGTEIVPIVTATSTDSNATIVVTEATTLPGSTSVLVIAEDGVTEQTYTIEFTLAPATDATLSDLQVDGETIDGFASGTLNYTIDLPLGTSIVPTVTATTTDSNATIEISPAASLPGTTSIVVTAEDGTTQQTYSVEFVLSASDDATLSDLRVDGTTVDGFVSGLLNYAIELPADQTIVPTVTATASSENATVEVVDATALPGVSFVNVTAEDGTTQLTYSIAFTLEEGEETVTGIDDLEDLHMFVSDGRLHISGESLRRAKLIEVYLLSGKQIIKQGLEGASQLSIEVFQNGVSIVRLTDEFNNVIFNRKIIISVK